MSPQTLTKFDPSQDRASDDSSIGTQPYTGNDTSWEESHIITAHPAPMPEEVSEQEQSETSATSSETTQTSPSVVRIPQHEFPQSRFIPLQKWEGIVLQVTDEVFVGRLLDLMRDSPDEEAEFPLEEVPSGDSALVEPGAIFYWNIGYLETRSGQRIRASMIRFRRLPVWTSEELEDARRKAKCTRERLGWY
jgi:hypothetical protein